MTTNLPALGTGTIPYAGQAETSCVVEMGIAVVGGGRVPPTHSGTFSGKSHWEFSGLKYVPSGHDSIIPIPSKQDTYSVQSFSGNDHWPSDGHSGTLHVKDSEV